MHPGNELAALRRQWAWFPILATASFLAAYRAAGAWWEDGGPGRWLAVSLAMLAYFSAVLWRCLAANHRPGEESLLPRLGPANVLTLLRAALMSAVAGFLFSPRPEGIYAWLPGLLYTLASLPDFVDGIVARKTDSVTELGTILDMTVDSAGVLVATTLAVQYGTVPLWYLPVGLARYLFVLAIRLRERAGLPVAELPFSYRRRGFAALKMGFMFVMLFPLFGPPGTHLAAAAFGLPFACGFLWDWGLVTGRIRPDSVDRFKPAQRYVLHALPWLLRILAVILALPFIIEHLGTPDRRLLGLSEAAATLLLFLGAAPRSAGILAVCLLGVNQNLAPLVPSQHLLVFTYIGLIFLGGGPASLWPVEEALIFRRIGDPGLAG